MPAPLDENQIVMRGLAIFLAVVVAFAVGVQFCVGAGILLGGAVFAALGWKLLGRSARPEHLRVVLGLALGLGLVTLWAS